MSMEIRLVERPITRIFLNQENKAPKWNYRDQDEILRIFRLLHRVYRPEGLASESQSLRGLSRMLPIAPEFCGRFDKRSIIFYSFKYC